MSNEISDNAEQGRYEIRVDGELAGFAEYETEPGRLVLTHTEVLPAFEGKGVGGALARGALDGVRARGLSVVPRCPFIKSWIDRHPDYQDLVAA
ncbi:GNAT family N-acetyltransferase [Actinomadura litoris]|uniref:GNAT family N-acetyltransferase n=1 Tax=Actinomadura litoris TaxID=2678616 RepID=A0A7K1LEA5_9ACTN|nr:GNAT family N-acetyltransferase [Actinomadura litoris]MUN42749.1 GNAT family N-acetyltransferase [Actinomadura litoris]